jgi:hypothetical protein
MKNYLLFVGIFIILLNFNISFAQITSQPGCTAAGEFIPHPENCQWFIQCTSPGQGIRGECPPGDLFNPIDRFCDPEDEVDCDAGLDWNGVCEERHIGLFFPHPLSCEMWILCQGVDDPLEGWCDEGMLFDPIERICDDAENVDCQITPPGRPDWNGVCEEEHTGQFFPHPDSCSMWIYCNGPDDPTEGDCPEGDYFDPIEGFCEDSSLVECNIVPTQPTQPTKPTQPTQPTQTTRRPTTIIPDPENPCPPNQTPESGAIFLPSEESCEQYIICIMGVPNLLRCRPGFHWNRAINFCDLPENANCPIRQDPRPLPDCPLGIVRLYPHPNNCEQFILCSNGNRMIQNCGHLQHFDITTERCLFRNHATCILDV